MIKGVSSSEQAIIQRILTPYTSLYNFYCYGSRVKGTHSPVSDLDILIKGKEEMPIDVLSEIKQMFDASSLPYVVNLTDYNKIEQSFYQLIEKDLISVF